MSFLDKVMKQKRRQLAGRMTSLPLSRLRANLDGMPIRSLRRAVEGGERIIAEVKKRSPRVELFHQADLTEQLAPVYERNGACAISVVTDQINFGMSLFDAKQIRDQVSLPVLVKDFIFDPYQIYEARAFGADAVLLIAKMLGREALVELITLTRELGMCPLVEVHSADELDLAQRAGAVIIGINNRDLDSLEVSLETTRRLIGEVQEGTIVISESGISQREEIEELSALGVDAFLIGGALLESDDPGALLRELVGPGQLTTPVGKNGQSAIEEEPADGDEPLC